MPTEIQTSFQSRRRIAWLVAMLLIGFGRIAGAQAPADSLRVTLTCDTCDTEHARTALGFVVFVADPVASDVEVAVTRAASGSDQQWTMTITGRGRFAGQDRRLTFTTPSAGTADQTRAEVERFLKLGLAEYAAATTPGRELDLTFTRSGETTEAAGGQNDPWNYWVFRTGLEMYGDSEQSQSSSSYYVNGSANRTTAGWKMRVGVSRSLSKSSFQIDETTTVQSRLSDWNIDGLVVKSLGPHWSFGLTSSVVSSTFSNSRLVSRVMPGVEYDLFPYDESSRRSLTFQYNVGPAFYEYEQETIFNRLSETTAQHSGIVSLGLRQPWGQAGGTLTINQHLQAPERTRVSFNGSVQVRLLKSLTLNSSGSYSRIRDLFTLEKGTATDEEVLLRQRQLATGYRYSFSVGFGFSFGALSNTTVNPRFGG